MANREARAGVIVFAAQEKAPTLAPCRAYGNKVVCVLEKADPDPHALQLALMTARLLTQRASSEPNGELDLEAALGLIEEGERALACHATIKRCHSTARNQIQSASEHVARLVERVEEILGELGQRLRR